MLGRLAGALRAGRLRHRPAGTRGATDGRRVRDRLPRQPGLRACFGPGRGRTAGSTRRPPVAALAHGGVRRRPRLGARSSASGSGTRTRGRSRSCTGAARPTRRRPRRRSTRSRHARGRASLIPLWGRKVLDLRPVCRDRQGHRPSTGCWSSTRRSKRRCSRATTARTSTRSARCGALAGSSRLGAGGRRRRRLAGERRPRSRPRRTLMVQGTGGVLESSKRWRRLMLFSELLRITVLLVAGVATALGALAVLLAQDDASTSAADRGLAGWWLVATVLGSVLGTSARAAEAIAPALRSARGPRRACRRRPRGGSRSCGCGRSGPSPSSAAIAGVILPAGRGDRRGLRDPHRPAVAPARGRGPGDRGSRRGSLLRRADVGAGADPPGSHAGALPGPAAGSEAAAAARATSRRPTRANANRAPRRCDERGSARP